MPVVKVEQPNDLRAALGIAFVHRTAVRWRAGTSALLDRSYDGGADATAIIDVRNVREFHTVRADRTLTSIGAFTAPETIAREASLTTALGTKPLGPHEARFRLAALDAQVVIAGPGATRNAGFSAVVAAALPAHEIPLAVTLRHDAPPVWFGDRRISRRDGTASFDLRVHVGLALVGAHRIVRATVAHSLDGGPPQPLPDVAAELDGNMIAKTTFAAAARRGADAFRGDDVRTNSLRRTIIPLLLSALNDAYAASRAARR